MFNNKRTKICLWGTLISLAILLITFFTTDSIFGDKEFSEYTSADWSIAIVPLAIMVASGVSTLIFAIILAVPMFKAESVISDYVANQKFSDIDPDTEFLVFDHDEFKRACCQTQGESTIRFSVKEYNIKEKKWHILEKGRCAEDMDSLIYILQKDYRFDEIKFITK